jgi:small subunit ribosomal protein S33
MFAFRRGAAAALRGACGSSALRGADLLDSVASGWAPALHGLAAAATSLRAFAGGAAARAAAPAAEPLAPLDSIEEARARIFGSHIGNGERSGRKLLQKRLLGAKLAAYYPEPIAVSDPLMLSLEAERAKLKLDRARRRGKAPPKKGSGKRSKK